MLCELRSMNDQLIDDEHEQLLFMLQDLAYGDGPGVADMDRLIELVADHFDHEKPLIERVGGGVEERHKKAHAHFLDRLTEIREMCMDDPDFARGCLVDVTARFISHTNTDDMELADALRELEAA